MGYICIDLMQQDHISERKKKITFDFHQYLYFSLKLFFDNFLLNWEYFFSIKNIIHCFQKLFLHNLNILMIIRYRLIKWLIKRFFQTFHSCQIIDMLLTYIFIIKHQSYVYTYIHKFLVCILKNIHEKMVEYKMIRFRI